MAFTFKLELEDRTPADSPTLHTGVPNWQAGDTISLGRDRTLKKALLIQRLLCDEAVREILLGAFGTGGGRRLPAAAEQCAGAWAPSAAPPRE